MIDPWYELHSLFDSEAESDTEMDVEHVHNDNIHEEEDPVDKHITEDEDGNETIYEEDEDGNETIDEEAEDVNENIDEEEKNENVEESNMEEEQSSKQEETQEQDEESARRKKAVEQLKTIESEYELENTKLKDYAGQRTDRLVHLLMIQKWVRTTLNRNTEHLHPLDLGVHRTNVGKIIVHLNSLLLQLDALELHGLTDVRHMRKGLVLKLEECLSFGEALLKRVDRLVELKSKMNVRFSEKAESVTDEETESTPPHEKNVNDNVSVDEAMDEKQDVANQDIEEDEQVDDGNEMSDESEDENQTMVEQTPQARESPKRKPQTQLRPQPTYEVVSRQNDLLITIELPLSRADSAVRTTLEKKPDHDLIRVHDEAGRFRDLVLDVKRDTLDTDSIEEYFRGRYLVLRVPRLSERQQWQRRAAARKPPRFHQPRFHKPRYQPMNSFFPRRGFYDQPAVWGW